jgi:glycosyltransferase involved in cell wall biosynthesis
LSATVFWIWGVLVGAGWTYKLFECAIGMPKVPDLARPEWLPDPGKKLPRISIIVPALNEQEKLEVALRSLLVVDYPDYEVIAINDRSTDRTGEIMDRLASENSPKLRVVHITALPERWLGKPNALQRGSDIATGEWLLFTDADVSFRPDALSRAIQLAKKCEADHLVIFPTLITESWGERMMLAFLSLAFTLRRLWKVSDPKARHDFIGVGAFNMVRRSAFDALGGMQPLRMEVVEDMKLGKLIKKHGFKQVAAFGDGLLTIHWARGAWGIVRNLRKNTFAFLGFSWFLTLLAIVGLLLVHLGLYVGIVFAPGWSKLGFAMGLLSLALFYVGIHRHLKISPVYFFLHPLSTLMMCLALLQSAYFTMKNGGIEWRGTRYPLEELRKGLV